MLTHSTYFASDGAAYELFLGRWTKRLAGPLLDFAGFSSAPLALPDGLPTLFEEAGLSAISRSSITIRMDYANFEDYWRPLLGGQGPVGTYVTRLSSELRCRIEEAVRSAYCSGAPDGERSLTATAWVVRGTVP